MKRRIEYSLWNLADTYRRNLFHAFAKRTSLLTSSISMNSRKGVHGPSTLPTEMVRMVKTAHLAAARHRERTAPPFSDWGRAGHLTTG